MPRLPHRVHDLTWAIGTGVALFLLSNPLVVVSPFPTSLKATVVITAAMAVLTWRHFVVPAIPVPVLAYMAFMPASLIWTINTPATLYATILYFTIALIALAISALASPTAIVLGLTAGGTVVAVGSWLLTRNLPFTSPGRLSGLGTNPNILAYTLCLATCGALALLGGSRWRRVALILTLAVSAIILVLARSATGILAFVALIAVATCLAVFEYSRMRQRPRARRAFFLLIGAACLLGAVMSPLLARIFGKDVTSVSGRMDLWLATIRATTDAPLLGYGWGAVWQHPWQVAPRNPVVESIFTLAGMEQTHGHNSLMDVLPQLGLLGGALVIAILAWLTIKSYRLLLTDVGATSQAHTAARFGLLVVTAHVILGYTEPLVSIPLGWFMLLLASTMVAQQLRVQRTSNESLSLAVEEAS